MQDHNVEITRALQRIRDETPGAMEELAPLVYELLKRLARSRRSSGHTLQPTELVHEAWMKLAPGLDRIKDGQHFRAAAALSIRSVLADHARARNSQKRGEGAAAVTLDEDFLPGLRKPLDLLVVHDCLEALERLNPRHAKVLELRVFGGLSIAETADILDVSATTVESDWRMARAWMSAQLLE